MSFSAPTPNVNFVNEKEKAKLFLNIFTVDSEAEMSFLIFSALDIRIIIRS